MFESERYGPCAFYCQQAAEKALKAVLYNIGERPWGYSGSALLDQICIVLKVDPEDAPQAESTALDEHYMRPRYPDARTAIESEYDQEIAQDALQDAQTVLAFAKKSVADVRKILTTRQLPIWAEEYARSVALVYNPDCIILFGSVARNAQKQDSDIDVLVIGGDLPTNHRERFRLLMHLPPAACPDPGPDLRTRRLGEDDSR